MSVPDGVPGFIRIAAALLTATFGGEKLADEPQNPTVGQNPFPWDEALALGLGILRLPPREFWMMTPRELLAARDGIFGRTHRHLHFQTPTTTITAPTGAALSGDLTSMTTTLSALDLSAQSVSTALNAAFTSASSSAKSFDQVLTTIVSKLATAALKPVAKQAGSSLQSFFSQSLSGLSAPAPTADTSFNPFTLYADGGIVSSPTFFGSGGGLGVMGERGAEAIMPLARGPDGTLGAALILS
eukprot:gene13990-14107_t